LLIPPDDCGARGVGEEGRGFLRAGEMARRAAREWWESSVAVLEGGVLAKYF